MLNKFKKAMLVLATTLLSTLSFAQNITVKGKVTDAATGEPLPGVAVLQKGTTNGIATKDDGTYTLNVPETSILVCSCFGYSEVEAAVNGRGVIDFKLTVD